MSAQARISAAVLGGLQGCRQSWMGCRGNGWSSAEDGCSLLQLHTASGPIQQVPAGLPWSN